MDLFFRGYDPNARITSAAQHLSAAAARFAVSIVRSIPNLPEAVWTEFKRLLTVDALWSLCLVLAGWLVATVVGGLVGLAVNALLIIYGLIELWEQVRAVWDGLKLWAMSAYEAQSEADLDVAAHHFAEVLSKGGITILEVVVTHRVFRSVEGRLRERFPTPEWLRTQYTEEARRRETARAEAKKPSLPERAAQATEVITSGARGEGVRQVANDFPSAAVVVGGVLLGIGTAAALAWAASMPSKRVSG